ncbi:MAG: hypothetical protein ACODAQ_09635 [Phycisphaeraceae bacterium]
MKWIIRIAVALVVVVTVGMLGVYIYLDTIAQRAIERGGTYATGVLTRVASVNVRLMAGEVGLNRLTVANPAGFEATPFLALDHGTVRVRPGSLMRQRVHIPRLHLEGVRLHLAHNARGEGNYQLIMANLERLAQRDPEQPGRHYVIEELVISDIELRADLPLAALFEQPIAIRDIRLTEVGSGSDRGVLMSQLAAVVVEAVVRKAAGRLLEGMPGGLLGGRSDDEPQADGPAATAPRRW